MELLIDQVMGEGNVIRVYGRSDRLQRHTFGITGSTGHGRRHLTLEIDAIAEPVAS